MLLVNLQVAKTTISKLAKLKPKVVSHADVSKGYSEVRRATGNSLLDPSDAIGALLNDGDYIIVCM